MEVDNPDLKTRVQSIFIDTVLIVAMMFVSAFLFEKFNPSQEDDGILRAVIFFIIWGVYEPVAISLGCTLGNYLMKIRVRSHLNNNKRINLLQAYIRFVVKLLLGWISFITISMNNERRAIHDFAANSVMIIK